METLLAAARSTQTLFATVARAELMVEVFVTLPLLFDVEAAV
jgi:hypothetical protein